MAQKFVIKKKYYINNSIYNNTLNNQGVFTIAVN